MNAKRSRRPMGLELRMLWGERNVGEYFMRPGGPAAFTVGTASGVDFPMGDRLLGAARFELVRRDVQGFSLRVTEKMTGTVTRGGEAEALSRILESGRCELDAEAHALALEPGDRVSVELGGVRLEAFFQPVPNPVLAAVADRLDYHALNVFLAVFFIGAVFVIAAENRGEEAEGYADELAGPPAQVRSIEARLAVAPPSGLIERLRSRKLGPAPAAAPRQGPEGAAGHQKATAQNRRASPAGNPSEADRSRQLIRDLFSGAGRSATAALVDGPGLGGELTAALGHVTGNVFGDARGLGGMGLRDTGGGGGGDARSAGIGRLDTHGRGGGDRLYGEAGGGPLAPKKQVVPEVEPPVVCGGAELACGLDRELVRQVIHAHRSQIRYCYENQLTSNPSLAGKVSVRFVIGASGSVGSSEVAQSTVHNPHLESCVAGRVRSWVFPRPKTGGVVVVTYPFLFRPAGE